MNDNAANAPHDAPASSVEPIMLSSEKYYPDTQIINSAQLDVVALARESLTEVTSVASQAAPSPSGNILTFPQLNRGPAQNGFLRLLARVHRKIAEAWSPSNPFLAS